LVILGALFFPYRRDEIEAAVADPALRAAE
jgi:hypothetical protein